MKAYKKSRGPVSLGLYSIQLQLNTLLEECGGEAAFSFLDTLSEVAGRDRQQKLLGVFQAVTQRLVDAKLPEEWDALFCHELEEELMKDMLEVMGEFKEKLSSRIEVEPSKAEVYSFSDYRNEKQKQELV